MASQKADNTSSRTLRYDSSQAFSHFFFSKANRVNWSSMSTQPIIAERIWSKKGGVLGIITDLLLKENLMLTVTKPNSYVMDIVYEFYENLSQQSSVAGSPFYHMVYVRGHVFDFSPAIIDEYFGRSHAESDDLCEYIPDTYIDLDEVATELIGVPTKWESRPRSSTLTSKYAILSRIGLCNWFPTSHATTIDEEIGRFLFRVGKGLQLRLGESIFKQTVSHADGRSSRTHLVFPSLICDILKSQHAIQLDRELCIFVSKFHILTDRFLEGKHLVDIQGENQSVQDQNSNNTTSPQIDNSTNNGAQIQLLRDSIACLDVKLEKILGQQAEIVHQQGKIYEFLATVITRK
ncbi:uncharacterized protein [Henckelia pumila]|uniref:uncharacterized protein isoform X1 n=1 Tax=Henckelia pumila TaxID=405737 RepID=UPI003C6E7EE4